ncbi:MAG: SH3 domain-containing protein [Oscillospiraceae bacterium]|nr:SH3 domain-containing protein [Oscillospiraceae bacterium]
MHRRIICSLLAVILMLGTLAVPAMAEESQPHTEETTQVTTETTVPNEPTGPMTTSDAAVAMLKKEEGFSSKPYWDYAQWTVGYGTKCPDDRLDYYKQYGISEAEAESLLRTYLIKFENELHKFMNRTGLELTQNQFDALLMFTYNCGSGWSYDTSGTFYNAIVSGATGNDLIYAFSRWSSAGGRILTALLRRRLCEANMYLNGEYSQSAPDNYGYVLYDACGGKTSPTVQGYDTSLTAKILSTPTRDGYTFAGWYTAEAGGTKVEILDASVKNDRLYAHWTDAQGNDASGEIQGTAINVTANGVNIRSGPGTNYAVISAANKGDKFVITETAEGTGYLWGKFSTGWICLEYTDYEAPSQEQPEEPKQEEQTPPQEEQKPTTKPTEPEAPAAPKTQMGTVKVSDCLRVRSGPSTGYDVVAYLNNGDRVEVLEQKIIGSMVWGKINQGWICLSYVTLDRTEEPEKPADTTEKVVATGTVKVNDFLRIRSGPGTSYDLVDYLTRDARVNILEMQQSGSVTWGRIDKGWISLDYVALDKKQEETPKSVTGTVKVEDFLRIRVGAGTSYVIAGYLSDDTKVEILEQKKVGVTTWGRIDKGWISLDYVVLDGQSQTASAMTKTVTADCLRIRSDAGTSNAVIGYLYTGTKVEILETKTIDGMIWGKIANGWISMDYVK